MLKSIIEKMLQGGGIMMLKLNRRAIEMKRIRTKKIRKLFVGALAGLASLAIGAMLLFGQANTVYANENTSDASTAMDYTSTYNQNSTQYSGRIWTDKSVGTSASYGNNNFEASDSEDEDFLVTFSALSSTQTIKSETASPIDVVFVLDFSASMTWGVNDVTVSNPDGSDSRIKYLVDSLNNAIDTLVYSNENNRIGIVTFNAVGETFMELTSASEIQKMNIPNKEYLELSHFSGNRGVDNGESTVTNNINGKERRTDSKTNIQYGLNQAMQILNAVTDTTIEINGQTVQRIPNVVLMSDGAPTTISQSVNRYEWWGELNYNNGDSIGWGDNSNAWSANGILPMMTASYMKEVITDKYFGPNSDDRSMNIYTIGFSTDYQTESMVELANLVLNPVSNFDKAQNSSYDEIEHIFNAWNNYVAGQEPSVTYPINSDRDPGEYRLEHSNPDIETLKYNTAYYAAEDSESLNDAFNAITSSMVDQGKAPTEITGSITSSGYITYVDTLGDYLEVKNVKGLVIGNQCFDGSYDRSNGVITFNDSYVNNIYGNQNLGNLKISVTENDQNQQVLTMQIPASLIPLVLDTIELDANGNVKSQTESTMYPMRLVYSVGLKEDILRVDGTVDLSKVASDYINTHTDAQGNVLFYSNYFDDTNDSLTGKNAGNTYVTYEPSLENEYYFVQEDTPLYLDQGNTPATEFDPNASYYVPFTYYKDGKIVTSYESRLGSVMEGYTEQINGQIYLKAGAPRLGNIAAFTENKTANETNTAETAYAPTFVYREGTNDPGEGSFHVYLGNNGQIKVPAASLTIEKEVQTNDKNIVPTDEYFTFEISLINNDQAVSADYIILDQDGNPVLDANNQPLKGTVTETNKRVQIKKDQKIQFNGLSVGTQYTVNEVAVEDPYTFTSVESTSDVAEINKAQVSGTLSAEDKVVTLSYTNTYETSVNAGIHGIKKISGREFTQGDTYTFTLSADENNSEGAVCNTSNITIEPISGNEKEIIAENAITFTKTGSYTFYLKEDVPQQPQEYMEYDTTEYKLTYNVGVDGSGNNLQVSDSSIQIQQEDGTWIDAVDGIVFNNRYNVPALLPISVQKNLTGRDWKDTDQFTFYLEASDEITKEAVASKTIIMPSDPVTVTSTSELHQESFGDITFTQEGTYTFTVKEDQKNKIDGITYDTDKTIIVKVEKINDVLTAVADPLNSNTVTFINEYVPGSYTLSGSNYLKIQKELQGKDWTDETFTFELKAAENYGNKVELPDVTELTLTKDQQIGVFDDIVFHEEGEYRFIIKEKIPQDQGNIQYDTHEYEVRVKVMDDGQGSLVPVAGVETIGSNLFTNTFTPVENTASISIHKAIAGREMNESDVGAYTFTISAVDGAPLPAEVTASNDAKGNVSFLPISYEGTQDVTYEYIIKETGNKNESASVETSKEEIHVKVNFDYDPTTGKITSNVTYTGEDGENDNTITNVYKATPVTIQAGITGNKTVTSSTGNAYTMVGNEFSFEIIPDEANPESDPITRQTVTNDANGNIVFAQAPTYTEAGTYTYTVRELNTGVGGITIDSSIYTVTVTIQDTQTGQLTQSVSIYRQGTNVDAITFNNEYDPAFTSVSISGTKNLIGKTLKDNDFAFLLKEISRTYTVIEEQSDVLEIPESEAEDVREETESESLDSENTQTITKEVPDVSNYEETVRNIGGTISFAPIRYDRPGVYVYQISEINEGKPGIVYDPTIYTVTVTVTDEAGVLKASVSGMENIAFNNSYVPDPVTLSGETAIKATKNFDGKELVGEDFTFILKDQNGNEVAEAKNGADGSITFEGIQFTQPGTYYYTLSEKNTSDVGVTFDGSAYVIKIEVVDAGGALEVSNMEYFKDNAKTDTIVFNNTYNPVGTSVRFYATKVLEGRDLKEAEFSFVMQDENKEVISQAKNDAKGIISFDVIEYDTPGTYVYTIREVAGDDKTVQYDDTVYTCTVRVEDVDGQLKPTITYDGDGSLVFRNKYEEMQTETPEDPEKGDTSNTSTQTNVGLFASLAIDAIALAGIATLMRKRNSKK